VIFWEQLSRKKSARIQADQSVKSLAKQVRERLFLDFDNSSKFKESNFSLWDIKVRERLQDKLRYCFTLVFSRTGDAALLPLPRSLYFIYYLLRPIRLVWQEWTNYIKTPKILKTSKVFCNGTLCTA